MADLEGVGGLCAASRCVTRGPRGWGVGSVCCFKVCDLGGGEGGLVLGGGALHGVQL